MGARVMDKTKVYIDKQNLHKIGHFVFRNGIWKAYQNKWKSQFNGPKIYAAIYARGPSISAIRQEICKIRKKQWEADMNISRKR